MNQAELLAHQYQGEKPLRTLLFLFRNEHKRMLLALLLFCIKHSPVWVTPLVTADIIDVLVQHKPLHRLTIDIAILIVSTLQNWPLNYLYVRLQSQSIRKVERDLRIALVTRMQELAMSFYNKTNPGVLQSKIIRDVENIEQMVRNITDIGYASFSGVVGAIIITAIKVPAFLPFFLFIGPLIAFFILALRKKLRQRNEEFRESIENMSGRFNVMTSLLPVTRAHGLESTALADMRETFTQVKERGFALDSFNGLFNALSWVTFQLANISCLSLSAFFAFKHIGGVTPGDVVLLTSFFGQLIGSSIMLANIAPVVTKGLASITSLSEVLQSDEIEDNHHKADISISECVVDFREVTYRYPGSEKLALQDISASARSGQMVALVGASGSGKTTFINLLVGHLKPLSGQVLVDGQDIHAFDLRSYRKNISVVPQETVLFEGSVAENVSYGLSSASEAEIESALRAANAWEFVSALQEGTRTLIGERGARLSGGQRQRIAIARALIRQPKLLILDEATSALDTESERAIQKSIEISSRTRTTFVVAHRLSTVRMADLILVLEDGQIVERGTDAELVAAGGKYASSIRAQIEVEKP